MILIRLGDTKSGRLDQRLLYKMILATSYSPLVIVSPIRDAEHIKKPYPVIVFVEKGAGGLGKKSVVQCDQIKSVDKSRIVRKRGRFSGDIMKSVDVALKVSLALT